MKVFISGATGYIGHQLAMTLASKNVKVHALVRNLNSHKVPVHKNIIAFKGNLCDIRTIAKAMESCDFVFHTAAYTNLKCKRIDNFYETNVIGTENILKVALKAKVKKVIYTSTLSVFGPSYKNNPITESQPRITSYANDYELTKHMSEGYVKQYMEKGLDCVILNISKVYGPGLNTYSNGVNKLITMFIKNDFLVVPNKLEATSNYVYIKDVVNAHVLAMESDIKNQQYIIGGVNLSYKKLFSNLKKTTGSKIKIITLNYNLVKFYFSIIGFIGSLSRSMSSVTPKVLDTLFLNRIATSLKAEKQLNYHSTSLTAGLKETIEHLKLQS